MIQIEQAQLIWSRCRKNVKVATLGKSRTCPVSFQSILQAPIRFEYVLVNVFSILFWLGP
jgi:hypothetical protein